MIGPCFPQQAGSALQDQNRTRRLNTIGDSLVTVPQRLPPPDQACLSHVAQHFCIIFLVMLLASCNGISRDVIPTNSGNWNC